MNAVVIDGITYTKAGTLAKKFRYTTDYIGQLCRAEKVAAQLVGRSWYVSESSLENYSGKRIEAIRQDKIMLENMNVFPIISKHIQVSAPLSKQTKRMLPHLSNEIKVQGSGAKVRYESDPVDLIPLKLHKPILPRIPSLPPENPIPPVDIADVVTTVPIQVTNNRANKLAFSQAPAVALKGKVKVVAANNPELRRAELPRRMHVTKNVTQVHSHQPDVVHKNKTATPAKKTALSFAPTSVVEFKETVSTPRYGLVSIGLLTLSVVFFMVAVLLDVEVRYDGMISSTSFSLNQTAFVNFFK